MRSRLDKRTGEFVAVPYGARPVAPRLRLHGDSMDPTWHPVANKTYDSKSAFRAATAAHGCYEVGNDRVGWMDGKEGA